jgi:hypothetical protein
MRTVPAGISALIGQSNVRAPIILMEWLLPSPVRYSSAEQVTYAGNVYAANRILSFPTFEAGYIDRKRREFSKLTIRLDNLADDGSSNFPIKALDAAQILEDYLINIYCYSPDAGDAVALWWGYSGRPTFDGSDKTVEVTATFFFDAVDMKHPNRSLQAAGFNTLDTVSPNSELDQEDAWIPIVYGVDNFKIRPVIYRKQINEATLEINYIVSGVHAGFPFNAGDVDIGQFRLFNNAQADVIEFLTGGADSAATPTDLTRYPDGVGHANVAFGYASFPIVEEDKNKLDDLDPGDVKIALDNGRLLVDTGLPSENGVLIAKDMMRDPLSGLGLASATFDAGVITSSANYVGTRYQLRYEFKQPEPFIDRIQHVLGDFHGFITWDNKFLQIRVKRNDETSVATFATADSGQAGRVIHNSYIQNINERDFGELVNEFTIKYRLTNRQKRIVTLRDTAAQARAGGTTKKPVVETIDQWEHGGQRYESQAAIVAAIAVREEQNANLFCSFQVNFWDGLDTAPGDIISVWSVDQFNNATNLQWRIIKQTFDVQSMLITFTCQTYQTSIYSDSTAGLGVDIQRPGDDQGTQGRPPDVTPVSVAVKDIGTNDTGGKQATIRGTWIYPVVDLAADLVDGITRGYPISVVQLWWRYTDEAVHQAKPGAEARYPVAEGEFLIDYNKNRSIEVWFIALGVNRGRQPLGLIPDVTKVTALTAILTSTGITASVIDSAPFANDDYIYIEREIARVLSKTATTITFYNVAAVRTAFFGTTAIGHPNKTELAVAKKSYPSLILALTAPRFTYPVITGLTLLQRNDGIRVKFNDPSAENQEKFNIYVSLDADGGSNVAKLGSSTPAWYLTDPETPGTGVTKYVTDSTNFKLENEILGNAGDPVFVRVAARNGKHNYSSLLSALGTDAWGDDDVPDLTGLPPRVIAKKKGLRVVTRRPTTNMKSLVRIEQVIRAEDAGATILGYLSDSTGDWTSSATEYRFDNGDNAHTYNIGKDEVQAIWPTVDKLKIYSYITNAVGTSPASPTTDVVVSSWQVESGSAVPGVLTFPASLTGNSIDGDPDKNLARIEVLFAPVSGTFGANNISRVALTFIQRNEANTANEGNAFALTFELRDVNLSQTSLARAFFLRQGKRFRIMEVAALNGDKRTETAGTLDFIAGGIRTVDTGDTKTVPAPTFGTIARLDSSNKEDEVPVTLTQDGVDIVWFKRLILEKSTNGGAYKSEREINLKQYDDLHASISGTHTWNFTVKRKAAVTAQYRVTAYAVGGKASATTTSSLQSATSADLPVPGSLNFPTITANAVDGDPEKNLARVTFSITTTNGQTLAQNNISGLILVFKRRNGDNSANVGDFIDIELPTPDYPIVTVVRELHFRLGQKYRLFEVQATNGVNARTITSGTLDFTAGGLRTVDTADAKTVPAPTFQSGPIADGNKLVTATVRLAQDGTDIVWFKKLIVESSIASGSFLREPEIGLKAEDALYASASAFRDFLIRIKRKQGQTVQLRVTAMAVGGKSSAATASSVLGASADDLPPDTGVPSGLATPVLEWTASNRLKVRGMTLTTNTTTLKGYKLVIYNGSTTYLDINGKTSTSTESVARYDIGVDGSHKLGDIKKKILKDVFGVSGTLFAYWYAENANGISVKSADSAGLSLTGKNDPMSDNSDGVIILDVGAAMNSKTQILPNGDLIYSRSTSTNLANTERRVSPFTSGIIINTTTTEDVFWDQDDDWIVWRSNSSRVYFPLKKWVKGNEVFTLTAMFKTDGSFGSAPVINVRVRDNSNNDLVTAAGVWTLTGITTSSQMYQVTFELIANLSGIGNRFLSLETSTVLSGTNNLISDKYMLVRGRDPATYSPRPQYEVGNSGDEDPDVSPTSTPAAIVDIGLGVGSAGGGFEEGLGGRIVF